MLKTVPFYSIIRTCQLREEFEQILLNGGIYLPKTYRQLSTATAEYVIANALLITSKSSRDLTNLVMCCKEYLRIANGK